MKKIILIGAGGHCASCVDVIELQRKFKIVGLIDNKKEKFLLDYKIIGSDKKLKKLSKKIQAVKKLLSNNFQKNIKNSINLYGAPGAADKIVEILKKVNTKKIFNKKFFDINKI